MTIMANSYPGACECGKWVAKSHGKTEPPMHRSGRWVVTCYDCMSPEEQMEHRRQAARLAQAQAQHAARHA